MFCLKCGHTHLRVTNSRQGTKRPSVWRRRKCLNCGFIFTTYEEISLDQLTVTAGKHTIPFSDARLLLSISRCLEHKDEKKAEHAKWLSHHIISELVKQKSNTISTGAITMLTFETLKRFDELASIQYAARHKETLKGQLRRFA